MMVIIRNLQRSELGFTGFLALLLQESTALRGFRGEGLHVIWHRTVHKAYKGNALDPRKYVNITQVRRLKTITLHHININRMHIHEDSYVREHVTMTWDI